MTAVDTTRGYLRALPGLPIETQRQMAEDAGCGTVYEWEGGHGRGWWISSLRAGDIAWTPSLMCLVTPRKERDRGDKPSAELAAVVAAVLGRGAVLVEGRTGRTSRDRCAWAERVQQAVASVGQSERQIEAQRQRAARARAAKPVGVTVRWAALREMQSPEWQAAYAVWTSAAWTLAECRERLPVELRHLSRQALYQLFGPRRPVS